MLYVSVNIKSIFIVVFIVIDTQCSGPACI